MNLTRSSNLLSAILKRVLLLSTVLMALCLPSLVSATETVTYTYDELGRLIRSQHSGTANDTLDTNIDYDPAGNRTGYETENSDNADSNPSAGKKYIFLPVNDTMIVPIGSGEDSGVSGAPGRGTSEPPPSFSITNAIAPEGGTLTFTITKSAATIGKYSLNWRTSDGTAINGSDYVGASGVMTFEGAETSKQIIIPTVDDEVFESTETFTIGLIGASNGATISGGIGTGTITNDGDRTNAAPNAVNDFTDSNGSAYTVGICEAITINVTANDNDNGDSPPDLPLTVISAQNTNMGQAAVSGNSVTFSANTVPGAANFSYTIRDSRGATATANVAVTVVNGQGCM